MNFNHSAFALLLAFLSGSFAVKGDVIVLKDASSMEVYNVEVAGKWILYTLDSGTDSPLQRIEADKVFAIKGADGELKTVRPDMEPSAAKAPVNDNSNNDEGPQLIEVAVAEDNAEIIKLYNTPILSLKKPKGEKDKQKFCNDFLTIWGITSESVLSDKNVQIDFVFTVPQGKALITIPQYKVRIQNKTSRPIYIDLANSFKFHPNGTAKPYYTNAVYSEGKSKGSGMSLNLGAVAGALGIGGAAGTLANGIGVGSGSGSTATVTTQEERFLMIPPKAAVFMPPMKYVDGSSLREDYESLYLRTYPLGGAMTSDGDMARCDGNKGFVHILDEDGLDDARLTREVLQPPLGHVRKFSEQDSPKKLKRLITYSTSPEFSTYSCIEYTMYVRGIMGANPLWDVPKGYQTNRLQTDDEAHLLVGVGSVKKK